MLLELKVMRDQFCVPRRNKMNCEVKVIGLNVLVLG